MNKKALWVFLIILVLVLQYQIWFGSGSVSEITRLDTLIAQQTEELHKIEIRNNMLRAEVKALKTHPQAFEERARLEHGMIKSGETFCLIVEPAR
jgi:cell division protein FtsB